MKKDFLFRYKNWVQLLKAVCETVTLEMKTKYLENNRWVLFPGTAIPSSNFVSRKQSFTDVLQNGCYLKFRKFYRKTPVSESLFKKVVFKNFANFTGKHLVLESLFNKVADLQVFRAATYWKEFPTQVFSYEICEIFKHFFHKPTPGYTLL